jgi:predicted ATPase
MARSRRICATAWPIARRTEHDAGTLRAVRIAFSGSHRVGKSTLLEHVAIALPAYTVVDEPYYLLEEDGYEAAEKPTIEDFVAQLERSLVALEANDANVLFDRCPVDIFAYLLTHQGTDAGAFDPEDFAERASRAMHTLDLVVRVPIEQPDRIPLPVNEDNALRHAVDEKIRELLMDDPFEFETEMMTVSGDLRTRAMQVMRRVIPEGV